MNKGLDLLGVRKKQARGRGGSHLGLENKLTTSNLSEKKTQKRKKGRAGRERGMEQRREGGIIKENSVKKRKNKDSDQTKLPPKKEETPKEHKKRKGTRWRRKTMEAKVS